MLCKRPSLQFWQTTQHPRPVRSLGGVAAAACRLLHLLVRVLGSSLWGIEGVGRRPSVQPAVVCSRAVCATAAAAAGPLTAMPRAALTALPPA